MIHKPEPVLDPGGDSDHGDSDRSHFVRVVVAFLGMLFAFGASAGAATAVFEDEDPAIAGIAVVFAFALAGVAAAIWLAVLLRKGPVGPEASSVKTSRRMLYYAFAVGAITGPIIYFGQAGNSNPGDYDPFADTPLQPAVALVLLVLLGTVVPWVTLRWHRSIDEHEAKAYSAAALFTLYAFFWICTVWWLGFRGGFTSEPDGKTIFLITMGVWTVGWLWRKYR